MPESAQRYINAVSMPIFSWQVLLDYVACLCHLSTIHFASVCLSLLLLLIQYFNNRIVGSCSLDFGACIRHFCLNIIRLKSLLILAASFESELTLNPEAVPVLLNKRGLRSGLETK